MSTRAHAEIRAAVAAGEYARAATLFEALSHSGAKPQDVKPLLDWVMLTTKCALAQGRARLEAAQRALRVVSAYRPGE